MKLMVLFYLGVICCTLFVGKATIVRERLNVDDNIIDTRQDDQEIGCNSCFCNRGIWNCNTWPSGLFYTDKAYGRVPVCKDGETTMMECKSCVCDWMKSGGSCFGTLTACGPPPHIPTGVSELIDELMDKPPPVACKIVYHGDNILDNNSMGKENTPTQVRYQPLSITWPDMKADHFYTLIMIDPDMPARSTPIAEKTQVLHWLIVNIPGAGVGGRNLAPYIGSGPPPSTGIHRYTFLVFDEGTSPKDYTSVTPVNLVQIGKRVNWNFVEPDKPWTLRGFMEWASLGMPICGNFYRAQWDSWVDQLWKTFDTYYDGTRTEVIDTEKNQKRF